MPGSIGRPEVYADGALLRSPCGALLAHRHQPADAPLVASPPRLDAPAQPDLLLRHLLVERRGRERFVGQPRLLLLEECPVIAGPGRQLTAVEFDDAARHPLEKHAVVRDDGDGAGIVLEKPLEPDDGVQIEMVRGFVEQQQRRRGDEGLSEQDAPAPPAGQRGDTRVRVERQPGEDCFDTLFDAPAIALLELVLQASQFRDVPFVAAVRDTGRGVMVGIDQIAKFTEPGRDGFEYRLAIRRRIERAGVLIEPRDTRVRRPPDRPAVRQDVAGQHLQQRRLPFAVAAEHGNALAWRDGEVDAFEKRQVAEGDGDGIQSNHDRARSIVPLKP